MINNNGASSYLDLLLAERLHGHGRPGAGLNVQEMLLLQHLRIPVGEAHHARSQPLVPARSVDREAISIQTARDRRHVAFFLGPRIETRETIRLPGFLGVLPIRIRAKEAETHVALNGSRVAVLAKNEI